MTHLAQRDKTNDCGPFETWRNPATGEESQFISFPVVNGRIIPEVTLAHEEHGQYMEWTFRLNNLPETALETVTMTRQQRPAPALEETGKTAVDHRTSPRLFVAVYVVVALAAVIAFLTR